MATLRQELQNIYEQNQKLTPALVVDAARDPDHALHGRFEWDDEKAGEKFRLHQARQLIRSVRIRVLDEEDPGKNFDVRAYQMVRTSDGTTSYQPSAAVAQDAFASRLILAHMEREWRALRDRYEHFREFWHLVNRDAEVHTQSDAIDTYGTYIAS